MKRTVIFSIIAVLLIIVVSTTFFMVNNAPTKKDPFYVGVTYGGDNKDDAKQLIDRVKDYTNLFVITSGPLQGKLAMMEICDYAVNAGLDVIVTFGSDERYRSTAAEFVRNATERYGSHFLGIYYGDEPGGKTLDGNTYFANLPDIGNVSKDQRGLEIRQENSSLRVVERFDFSGQITLSYGDLLGGNMTYYNTDGTITFSKNRDNPGEYDSLTYYPNGTVTLQTESITNPVVVTDRGSIPSLNHTRKSGIHAHFKPITKPLLP